MKKTIKEKKIKASLPELEIVGVIEKCEECKKVEIDLISEEMGREDLNSLAKKINEIIKSLNK